MKRTIGTLATMILLFSAYSCSKDSSSTATLGTNQASIGGTTKDFSVSTTASKTSANAFTFKGSTAAAGAGDYVELGVASTSSNLTAGTYKLSNTNSLTLSARVGNSYYSNNNWVDSTNFITITSIDTMIVGSYSARVYASTDTMRMSPMTLIGNFKSLLK